MKRHAETIRLRADCIAIRPARVLDTRSRQKTPQRASLRLATFDVDATPPVGFMMAYDRVKRVEELGLRCRGVVILGAQGADRAVCGRLDRDRQ